MHRGQHTTGLCLRCIQPAKKENHQCTGPRATWLRLTHTHTQNDITLAHKNYISSAPLFVHTVVLFYFIPSYPFSLIITGIEYNVVCSVLL